ncbi:MAG: 3-oxoacyl-[acyl-carrier protein] reductase [Thermoleophilaceae bacterium]|nr:3-oxoacyl-[acyl-carrier protein] reductase [Thermoleophilaceae bacterium]
MSEPAGPLAGKVAVVTGAGRGIGAATAERLARDGAAVVLNDLDADVCADTANRLLRAGLIAAAAPADVAGAEGACGVIRTAAETFGHVDIVVNNAGTTRDGMFHRLSPDDWDFVMRANLSTAYHVTRAALERMRPRAKELLASDPERRSCGKIVMTSSTSFLKGNVGQSNYAAAKGAIVGFVRSLARELAPLRIGVNAAAPGFVETRLTDVADGSELGMPEAARTRAVDAIPLGYPGQPADVAGVHAFLAGSDSDYLTGQIVVISGGTHLH